MNIRLNKLLEESIPAIDREDLGKSRQFAPEYSACVYERLIDQESAIGDYTSNSPTY